MVQSRFLETEDIIMPRPETPTLSPREQEARRLESEARGSVFAPVRGPSFLLATLKAEREQRIQNYIQEGLARYDAEHPEEAPAAGHAPG